MAMGPKVDSHLFLAKDRKSVTVTGPVGDWDPYLKSATFAVVIGQTQHDEIVLAVGRSKGEVKKPAKTWTATATVLDPATEVLVPGLAYAWAVASGEAVDGEYEPYDWSVYTRLLAFNAPKPT